MDLAVSINAKKSSSRQQIDPTFLRKVGFPFFLWQAVNTIATKNKVDWLLKNLYWSIKPAVYAGACGYNKVSSTVRGTEQISSLAYERHAEKICTLIGNVAIICRPTEEPFSRSYFYALIITFDGEANGPLNFHILHV